MRRGTAHLTVVVGQPTTVDELRQALVEHSVDHAAVIAHIGSIRRSLVLGEKDFVVVCIALDQQTINQHGQALRRLLADHRCFPTAVRTVGLLTGLGFTREVAELGCDVYVDDSAQAAKAVRLLLNDAWTAGSSEMTPKAVPAEPQQHWDIRGGWMFGSPDVPAELTSLISSGPGRAGSAAQPNPTSGSVPPSAPHRIDRSGRDFVDPQGP